MRSPDRTYGHALVVGKFAPLHRGHQLLLDHAASIASQLTVIVWSTPDFVDMPTARRAGWVRALYPDARVIAVDDGPRNDLPDEVHRSFVAQLLATRSLRPDVVVSSEAYGPGFADHLGIAHELVDLDRTTVPTSGTMIRADVHAHRHLIDPVVYRDFVDKVVFLGAESTGKSTLAARMADELGTVHVEEYGRRHYEERDGRLELEDYVTIARRHRALEDDAARRANRWLFVDTNALTTMFFSHYYDCDSLPELRTYADECRVRYQHVIVCDDGIPFAQDGWRDNETWRARMQGMVLHDLVVRDIPFHVVRGSLDERVAQVKAILDGRALVEPRRRVGSLGPRPVRAGLVPKGER